MVMESIIADGQVIRGWIGVEPQDITREMADSFNIKEASGAIVAGVIRGGPADRAGIRPGDILIAIEGKPISNKTEVLNVIAQLKPNNKSAFTVLRNATKTSVDILIGKRPSIKREE
jgi:serine protease DegQ